MASGAAFFQDKYLTNGSIMPEDQVIAAAACLTNILQGIRSPQLHTSTLKLLCDLQDIFYEVANTTQDPSPTQSLHTPLRVTPTPTPGNNVHNINDARNVNDVGHVKDGIKSLVTIITRAALMTPVISHTMYTMCITRRLYKYLWTHDS